MELPLGLSDAVTHLSYAGGLSGNLHFSQSLLALVLAKELPEFLQEFRSVASGLLGVLTPVPELARCLPAVPSAAVQNENFLFIIHTFLPVSSKPSSGTVEILSL